MKRAEPPEKFCRTEMHEPKLERICFRTRNANRTFPNVDNFLLNTTNSFFNDISCKPLEGKLTVNEGKLEVDLGIKQGLKQKQIGLVNGIEIQNSMLNNSLVIVHTENVFDNHSTLLPLNDNIKLTNLNNKTVKFVE